MRLIDLGDTIIDQFLVQLFLFLEPENLARFVRQNTGNLVEGHIMIIGIIGRHSMHRRIDLPGDHQRCFQRPIRLGRTVNAHNDWPVTDRCFAILDNQRINRRPAHHAFTHTADNAAGNRAQPL